MPPTRKRGGCSHFRAFLFSTFVVFLNLSVVVWIFVLRDKVDFPRYLSLPHSYICCFIPLQGLLAGGSGGLNVFAALRLAKSLPTKATIVTVLPDSGIKYLSKVAS